MFSNVDPNIRNQLTEHLEKLGAIVSDLPNYDPDCTHLLCEKPLRNEKILAAMAAGKWILHTSYVEQCVAARKLIDVRKHYFIYIIDIHFVFIINTL